MAKFLLAILFLVVGAKLTAESQPFVYKYDFAKCAEQDEEQKIKEQEKGKYDTADKMCCSSVPNPSFLLGSTQSLKIGLQQAIFTEFINSPKTPPPDIA